MMQETLPFRLEWQGFLHKKESRRVIGPLAFRPSPVHAETT